MHRRTRYAALIALLFAAPVPLFAESPATRPSHSVPAYFSDATGLALHGYDVVSYFDHKPTPGSPEITAKHAGLTFRFATEEHRKAFTQSPEKYLPQYGGYCAFGLAKGHKAPTSPTAYAVHNGKLYLNYNDDVAAMWNKEKDQLIKEADSNWPALKEEPGPAAR